MPMQKAIVLAGQYPAPLSLLRHAPAHCLATADLPAAPKPSQLSPPGDVPAPSTLPLRPACEIVRRVIGELMRLFQEPGIARRDRRRVASHIRQIAMYVCHVALRISMTDVGEAFGRDRTTVSHACQMVENRRDDPVFDEFVAAIERIVTTVFLPAELPADE